MSATLDKKQGITFLYQDLYTVFNKARSGTHASIASNDSPRVIKKSEDPSVQAYQAKELDLNKSNRHFPLPLGVREAEQKATAKKVAAMQELRKNMENLSGAQARLRFLLKELNDLSKKE